MNKSKIFGVFLIVGSIMMLLSGMDIIADFNMFKVFGSIFLVYILELVTFFPPLKDI